MEKLSVDSSARARTNPVFMTAKTSVCLMAQAGIPDAEAVVRRLGLGSAAEVSGMKDAGMLLGNEQPGQCVHRESDGRPGLRGAGDGAAKDPCRNYSYIMLV